MGQIMAFGFWQRLCRARPVLWFWNECRKGSQQRQLAVNCHCWESKMEIPDNPSKLGLKKDIPFYRISATKPFWFSTRGRLTGFAKPITSSTS
jgi:hypothetical protein